VCVLLIAESGACVQWKRPAQVRGGAANPGQFIEGQNKTLPTCYTDCPPVIAHERTAAVQPKKSTLGSLGCRPGSRLCHLRYATHSKLGQGGCVQYIRNIILDD